MCIPPPPYTPSFQWSLSPSSSLSSSSPLSSPSSLLLPNSESSDVYPLSSPSLSPSYSLSWPSSPPSPLSAMSSGSTTPGNQLKPIFLHEFRKIRNPTNSQKTAAAHSLTSSRVVSRTSFVVSRRSTSHSSHIRRQRASNDQLIPTSSGWVKPVQPPAM